MTSKISPMEHMKFMQNTLIFI